MWPLLHPTDPKELQTLGRIATNLPPQLRKSTKFRTVAMILDIFLHFNSLNCFLGRRGCGEGRTAWTRVTASPGQRGRLAFVHLNSTQAQNLYKNLLQGLRNCISGDTDSAYSMWVNKCFKHGRKVDACVAMNSHCTTKLWKASGGSVSWSWERSVAVWLCGCPYS